MELWDFYARFYGILRSNPVSYFILKHENQSIDKLLQLRQPTQSKSYALDLGTGLGESLKHIPSDFTRIFAIDKSSKMISFARHKYQEVDFSIGDAIQTPYASGSMDLLMCVGLSEYVENVDELMKEIHRLLSNSGYAIFTSAPPTLLNLVRKFFGHSLYVRSKGEIENRLIDSGLNLIETSTTLLQDQYLITREQIKP